MFIRKSSLFSTFTAYKKENKKAVLSQGEQSDVVVNFDKYRILQRHRAVSLPQQSVLVGLCLQTAVNHLSVVIPLQKEYFPNSYNL